MALNAYLKLKGQQQGDIDGSVTIKGREDSINVFSYSFGSEASDGQPHPGVFMVAIDADESSPKIMTAFTNQENLTQWELDVWVPNINGQEILEQKWVLTNAKVESYRSGAVVVNGSAGAVNEVTFTFQKVEHIWLNGGITSLWQPGGP